MISLKALLATPGAGAARAFEKLARMGASGLAK
jgi:hypothetical protein